MIENPKVGVLLADPPWAYEVWSEKGKGRSADKHYKTQKLDWIKSLPVESILSPIATVFMWVTAPCLQQGMEVGEAWGLTYKTIGFTWVKTNRRKFYGPANRTDTFFMGQGYYTRANTELCLIFTRGKKSLPVLSHSVRQVVTDPITRHSAKPVTVHRRINELYGNEIPKIELFARRPSGVESWIHWGNEIIPEFTAPGFEIENPRPRIAEDVLCQEEECSTHNQLSLF